MTRKTNSRAAQGSGSIRKKNVVRNGRTYTYWEARITTGYDLGTGKQIQRYISGKTQKEVREKMQEIAVLLNTGAYQKPSKMTLGEWLQMWKNTYLNGVKATTRLNYEQHIKNHIVPALGAVRLEALKTHMIQAFYNDLSHPHGKKGGLSAKTIKNIHGVLHKALQQAVVEAHIRINPADACILPRVERKEISPLDSPEIMAFMKEIQGNRFERVFLTTLFTGLRRGEVCGLTWDCVNLENRTIHVNKQLQASTEDGRQYRLVPTKNGKGRTLVIPPFVAEVLKKQKIEQSKQQLKVGKYWNNPEGYVFTNEIGQHISPHTLYHTYKKVVAKIGIPTARFHDLRHSYAVAAIRAGDDIKTVQGNMGHATASFTLDVYGHVTAEMKQDSADKMEKFIETVSGA